MDFPGREGGLGIGSVRRNPVPVAGQADTCHAYRLFLIRSRISRSGQGHRAQRGVGVVAARGIWSGDGHGVSSRISSIESRLSLTFCSR